MVTGDKRKLSDRNYSFLLDRLRWVDQEITRYRDIEWKATSFHTAFFVALIFVLLDGERRGFLLDFRVWLTILSSGYLLIACAQLVYIHKRLNDRRNERNNLLERLGERASPQITAFLGLIEGWGAIFPAGFLVFLVSLFVMVVLLICGKA